MSDIINKKYDEIILVRSVIQWNETELLWRNNKPLLMFNTNARICKENHVSTCLSNGLHTFGLYIYKNITSVASL